jgi:hypothetical protein
MPIRLNGTIHVVSIILKFVAASAAEAKLGALFVNAKEGCVIRLILHEFGPPNHQHLSTATIPQPLVSQTTPSNANGPAPWR